jgi:hypothetical protein
MDLPALATAWGPHRQAEPDAGTDLGAIGRRTVVVLTAGRAGAINIRYSLVRQHACGPHPDCCRSARRACVRRRARLPPCRREPATSSAGRGSQRCGRPAAMLSIGDSHRCQFRVLAMVDAELDAPTEDHAGRDIVAPANRRGTDARLFSLHHDRKLLRVGKAAPVRPSIARRSGSRGVCQAVFEQLLLSSAASITAYRRTDTGMKTRTPVDLHWLRIETGAPGTQAVDRDAMTFGVSLGGQSAPAQRLDGIAQNARTALLCLSLDIGSRMRLRSSRALIRAIPARQTPSASGQCATDQSAVAAIFSTAHATSMPCLDVNRPKETTCLVLEVSLSHRRSSIMRRNPISFAGAPPNRCAKPGRLHSTA